MSDERPEESSGHPATSGRPMSDASPEGESTGHQKPSGGDPASHQATILVRGETIGDQDSKSPPKASEDKDIKDKDKSKDKPARKEVSAAKVNLQSRLPALEDDADVGIEKHQVVTRDGKADLAFTGTLRASAAPSSAPKGKWQEYRIYETSGGKHVFSRVKRSIFAEDQDVHEAEIFEPSPSSVPSQLLRTARDLTRSRPLTWMDAAVEFFGYDPLAKALYRKVGGQFEEHIS